jgi:hypothetical protein
VSRKEDRAHNQPDPNQDADDPKPFPPTVAKWTSLLMPLLVSSYCVTLGHCVQKSAKAGQ